MSLPKHVKIVEVSPRDGLQNETKTIPTEIKIEFINQLSNTGLKFIEVTSFVSSKRIPQLADNKAVYAGIEKKSGITYSCLVPNLIGLEDAIAANVKEIAVFTTPSEQFSQKNTHCSVAESMQRITEVVVKALAKQIKIRAYISCVLGCPYEGEIAIDKVVTLADALYKMGCSEISLGDTIGVGTPLKTQQLLTAIGKKIPLDAIAVHFHDTYGQALANILIALQLGVQTVDSSTAGLGGCPYAKGATGNVATEDVLYMLNGMGIKTDVDLNKIVAAGRFISRYLDRKPQSKVALALTDAIT